VAEEFNVLKEEEREGEFSAGRSDPEPLVIFRSRLSWPAANRRVFAPRACRNSRVSRGTLKRLFNIRRVRARALVESARRGWSAFVQKSTFTLSASERWWGRAGGGGAGSRRAYVHVSACAAPYVRIFSE